MDPDDLQTVFMICGGFFALGLFFVIRRAARRQGVALMVLAVLVAGGVVMVSRSMAARLDRSDRADPPTHRPARH